MSNATIHEAKTNLSRLILEVERGGEVVISRGKRPVAKLVPLGPVVKKRRLGIYEGEFHLGSEFFAPLSESELAEWES